MNSSDWIKIEPGCREPKEGDRYLVVFDNPTAPFNPIIEQGLGPFPKWARTATHWLPIVPPKESDQFEAWWATNIPDGLGEAILVPTKEAARAAWDAALEQPSLDLVKRLREERDHYRARCLDETLAGLLEEFVNGTFFDTGWNDLRRRVRATLDARKETK